MADTTSTAKVRITADRDSSVKREFDRVSSGLKQINDTARRTAAGLGSMFGIFAGGALVAGIARGFRSITDSLDQLAKSSQATGVSVERLTELKYQADLSGASFETLESGLIRFNQRLAEVEGGTTKASNILAQLGVTAGDTTYEALRKVSDGFARMDDGATKTAAASELFGRTLGARLIPMLNGGTESMDALAKEARDAGLVMSTETARDAETLNDNLSRLGSMAQGVATTLLGPVVQGLADVSSALIAAARDADSFADALVILRAELVAVSKYEDLRRISTEIGSLKENIRVMESDLASSGAKKGGFIGRWLGDTRQLQIDELRLQLDLLKEEKEDIIKQEAVLTGARKEGAEALTIQITAEKENAAAKQRSSAASGAAAKAESQHATEVERTLQALQLQIIGLREGERAKYAATLATKGWTQAEMELALALYDQVDALEKSQRGVGELAEETDILGTVVERVGERMTDTFADAFYNILRGGTDSMKHLAEQIKDIFFRMLADMASAALANPIRIAIGMAAPGVAGASPGSGMLGGFGGLGGTSFGTGAGSFLASATSYFGLPQPSWLTSGFASIGATPNWAFGLGGIGGALLGSSLFQGGYSGIGSSLGSGAGTLIGAALGGPVGAILGGLLGGTGGGFLGSLFGGDERNPRVSARIVNGRFSAVDAQDLDAGMVQEGIERIRAFNAAIDELVAALPPDAAAAVNAINTPVTGFGYESLDRAMQNTLRAVLEAASSQLDFADMLPPPSASIEEWARSFQALSTVAAYENKLPSPVEAVTVAGALAEANRQIEAISGSLHGNIDNQERLAQLVVQRYELEVAYLTQLKGLQESISAALRDTTEIIEGQFDTAADVFADAGSTLKSIIDELVTADTPEEIAKIGERANAALREAWAALVEAAPDLAEKRQGIFASLANALNEAIKAALGRLETGVTGQPGLAGDPGNILGILADAFSTIIPTLGEIGRGFPAFPTDIGGDDSWQSRLDESADRLRELVRGFDGSAAAVAELEEATRERYELELDYLRALSDLAASITADINAFREDVRTAFFTPQEIYDNFKAAADAAAEGIYSAESIEEIDKYTERALEAAREAWAALLQSDPEEARRRQQEYLDYLDELQALADERIAALREQAEQEGQDIRDIFGSSMDMLSASVANLSSSTDGLAGATSSLNASLSSLPGIVSSLASAAQSLASTAASLPSALAAAEVG